MAKGSFLGVKRGKLGDAVGYNVTNSNDKDKQGWRVYQPVVRNPQSDGQIDQRVKLQAVNNLYRALKPIIQRGWENHKYGDESRRAFLKLALGTSFEGPYLEKGSTLAVPIKNVPIMYGSLTPIVMEATSNGDAVLTNVPADLNNPTTTTLGEVSQALIAAGVAQEGDQITFVVGFLNGAGTVSYLTRSFYVNASDTTLMMDLDIPIYSNQYDGVDTMVLDMSTLISGNITYAVLCSVSRDGDAAGVHLRSIAEFDMTTEFNNYFYGNPAAKKAAAKESYLKKTGDNTNWEQVPGGGGYTPVVQSAFTRAGTEFTPIGIRVVDPGQNQYLCIYDGEGNNYYIESYESSSSSLHVFLTGTGASTTAQPTGMTTANSVDVYDSNNVAAGLRAWLISKGVSPTVLPVRS